MSSRLPLFLQLLAGAQLLRAQLQHVAPVSSTAGVEAATADVEPGAVCACVVVAGGAARAELDEREGADDEKRARREVAASETAEEGEGEVGEVVTAVVAIAGGEVD